MDLPTKVILISVIVATVTLLFLHYLRAPRIRRLGYMLITTSIMWAIVTACGEFLYSWAGNITCSPYLGCVEGFAGYDAFEHLFFGIAFTVGILYVALRYPTSSLLPQTRWKRVLIVLAMVALVAVSWEILECMHDALRLEIFHETLRSLHLHINFLDQPTNLDTMGDLVFTLLGSCIGLLI